MSVDNSKLQCDDKLFLFISHRWHDALVPDDGTLVDKIFQFCLSVVLKNNFPHLPCIQEVHHSKTLSQKLTALIQGMDPSAVMESQVTFGRFDDTIAAFSSDPIIRRLIRQILSKFYLWIDFCCLPQVHLANGKRVERTAAEDQYFLAGLDGMDTLLENTETVIFWRASEVTRAWLFYESLMSLPGGRASFMMPMEIIAALSSIVRQYHAMFSQLGILNSLYMIDTFQKIGIRATSHRDISKIILLMESNLRFSEWQFRIIQ